MLDVSYVRFVTKVSAPGIALFTRESVLGQQEIAWSQITETRYRVVPINVYAHLGLIGAVLA